MSSITTLIYQYLRNQFSKLDWTPGSIIRELVAEPIVGLSEQANTAINNTYESLDISELLANPEAHADEIDRLFDSLGLTNPETQNASGMVRLLVSGSETFQIMSGTSFVYENTVLGVTGNFTATLTPAASTDLALVQVGVDSYEVIVPVSATSGICGLSEGTELTWNGISADVYSATVYSNITGGRNAYTATQKINRVRQYLAPQSLTCREGLVRTFNYNNPELVVDCLPTRNGSLGAVQLFTKTSAAPTTWRISAVATMQSAGVYQVNIPATGVAAVKTINGTTPTAVSLFDRTLTATYSSESSSATEDVVVEVFGLAELVTAQRSIDQYTENTGVRFNVQTPGLVEVSMYLPVSGAVSTTAVNAIVAAINGTLLDSSAIGDTLVRNILADYNITLNGAGVYTLRDYETGRTISNIGTINATPFSSTTKPVACYSAINLITVGAND